MGSEEMSQIHRGINHSMPHAFHCASNQQIFLRENPTDGVSRQHAPDLLATAIADALRRRDESPVSVDNLLARLQDAQLSSHGINAQN